MTATCIRCVGLAHSLSTPLITALAATALYSALMRLSGCGTACSRVHRGRQQRSAALHCLYVLLPAYALVSRRLRCLHRRRLHVDRRMGEVAGRGGRTSTALDRATAMLHCTASLHGTRACLGRRCNAPHATAFHTAAARAARCRGVSIGEQTTLRSQVMRTTDTSRAM